MPLWWQQLRIENKLPPHPDPLPPGAREKKEKKASPTRDEEKKNYPLTKREMVEFELFLLRHYKERSDVAISSTNSSLRGAQRRGNLN